MRAKIAELRAALSEARTRLNAFEAAKAAALLRRLLPANLPSHRFLRLRRSHGREKGASPA